MIVWDEPKRIANLVKHDLDFADFEAGFDFATALAVPTKPSQTRRARSKLIGSLHGRLVVAAIVSPLGTEALALISLGQRVHWKGCCMAAIENAPDDVPNPSYSQADWDAVGDNPEWTADDFRNARPFVEAFPALAEGLRRSRGPQRAPVKIPVTIRLDAAIVDAFKATGDGWQTRMNDVLREAAAKLGSMETKG